MYNRELANYILEQAKKTGRLQKGHSLEDLVVTEETSTIIGVSAWGYKINKLIEEGKLDKSQVAVWAEEFNDKSFTQANTLSYIPEKAVSNDTPKIVVSRNGIELDTKLFPVANWEKYEFISLLGEGGMGKVYKAKDLKLNRYVAIKFFRENLAGDERFLTEAQAQASIRHKNICEVYEIAEVEEKPYIAMQFIDGFSLKEIKKQLTLEQKVKIIKEISEAIHSTHRLGIIHRDIKPSNILIQRTEEGLWHPYLMDFGLARQLNATGNTLTGTVLGTPAYMPPEQAKGEINSLDRRTDIYSLGATLYDLLTNQPPFNGNSLVDLILKVVKEEPIPINKLNKDIPSDLVVIVMKCLEKEQSRRYDSAKALAEDLSRFLDGEPIQARKSSLTYKIIKKTQKHKLTVTVSILGILLTSFFSIAWIKQKIKTNEQTRLAQQYGQEIEKIESSLRYSYMLPLHNINPDKEKIFQRMNFISQQVNSGEKFMQGPGHYALGKGYLALHEYEKARMHLEESIESGYQTPEVNFALGQAIGALYRKELETLKETPNKEQQEIQRKEIEKEYKEPVLKLLKTSNLQSESSYYLEALIAFYGANYQQALIKTQEAFRNIPWLYEAKKLEGDIYLSLANQLQEQGNEEESRNHYNLASNAYTEAIKIAESDASLYESQAELFLQLGEIKRAKFQSPKELFDQAQMFLDKALIANPESVEAKTKRALLYWRQGIYMFNNGEDPIPNYEQAIEILEKLISQNPDYIKAYQTLGAIYSFKGQAEFHKGQDSSQTLEKGKAILEKALSIKPDFATYNALGSCYMRKGNYEIYSTDPRPSLKQAIANFEKAVTIKPTFSFGYGNLALTYSLWADYELNIGNDPSNMTKLSLDYLRKARELNPKNITFYQNSTSPTLCQAEYKLLYGQNPTEILQNGISILESALALKPDNPAYTYRNLGEIYLLKAEYDYQMGLTYSEYLTKAEDYSKKSSQLNVAFFEDDRDLLAVTLLKAKFLSRQEKAILPVIEEGRQIFEQGIKKNSRIAHFWNLSAQLELEASKQLINKKLSPIISLEKALSAISYALKLNEQEIEFHKVLAEIYVTKAEWQISQKQSPNNLLDLALESLNYPKTLSMPEAILLKGQIYLLKADLSLDNSTKTQFLAEATSNINKAFELNAFLAKTHSNLHNSLKK